MHMHTEVIVPVSIRRSSPNVRRMLTTSLAIILSQTMEDVKEMGTNSICTHQCGGLLGLNTQNRNRDNIAPVGKKI